VIYYSINGGNMSRIHQNHAVCDIFCHLLLSDKRYLPFDDDEPTPHAANRPTDLSLFSAELKAFKRDWFRYKRLRRQLRIPALLKSFCWHSVCAIVDWLLCLQ